MNIFLCCLQSSHDYPIAPYKFWRENFKPALEAMGHRVIEPTDIDFAAPLARSLDRNWLRNYRAMTNEKLLTQIRECHKRDGVDLFFSYFYSVHVTSAVISDIQQLGIPTVNFFCDNLRGFHMVEPIIQSFTVNWVPEKAACDLYAKKKAPHLYLPMAANPQFYEPSPGDEIPQVSFVGSADELRTRLLAKVFAGGVPLQVYGGGWQRGNASSPIQSHRSIGSIVASRRASFSQHLERLRLYGIAGEIRHLTNRSMGFELLNEYQHAINGSVSHADLLHLGHHSAVLLGINRCPHPGYPLHAPLVYSRLRDIEGPMMGACYLTEYCPDLDDLYEIGREIMVYRSAEELVEIAKTLCNDKEARHSLRKSGRQASLSRHTWQHRFKVLFDHLGLRR